MIADAIATQNMGVSMASKKVVPGAYESTHPKLTNCYQLWRNISDLALGPDVYEVKNNVLKK